MNTTTNTRPEAQAAESALAAAMAAPTTAAQPEAHNDGWEGSFAAYLAAAEDGATLTEWSVAKARLDMARGLRDAWEATAPDEDDDDRYFPAALRDEISDAEDDVLNTPAPDWQALAFKATLLFPYLDGDVYEPGWTPDPKAPGFEGAFARLLIATTEIGKGEATRQQAILASYAAEDLAHAAVTAEDGYRAYAVGGSVAEMAAAVNAIQRDARELTHRPGLDGITSATIHAVWFHDEEPAPVTVAEAIAEPITATLEPRGEGPDLRPRLKAAGVRIASAQTDGGG